MRGILVDSAGKPTCHPLEAHLTIHARLCVGACAVDRRGNVQWSPTSSLMDKHVRRWRSCLVRLDVEFVERTGSENIDIRSDAVSLQYVVRLFKFLFRFFIQLYCCLGRCLFDVRISPMDHFLILGLRCCFACIDSECCLLLLCHEWKSLAFCFQRFT